MGIACDFHRWNSRLVGLVRNERLVECNIEFGSGIIENFWFGKAEYSGSELCS